MTVLVVSEQGGTLAHREGRFELRASDVTVTEVKDADLRQVVVMGRVQLSPDAIDAALRLGVDVSFVSLRGRWKGRLVGPSSSRPDLTSAQHRAASDAEAARCLAAAIVRAKIRNQRALLLRRQEQVKSPEIAKCLAGMRRMADDVEAAATIDAVRGHEGQAAALYWKGFGLGVAGTEFTFRRRVFRPPTDPINAALSFGYALLTSEADAAVRLAGLDPGIGFLHEPSRRRPSLALDLMEEFRPVVVDRMVLRLVNRRELAPSDFEIPDLQDRLDDDEDAPRARPGVTPIHLAATGRRIVLAAVLGRLRERVSPRNGGNAGTLRWLIEAQARHLGRVLVGEEPAYVGFAEG